MTNRERVNEIELQDVPLTQRRRTRGLFSQISAVLLQPVYFFRTLPHLSETRQWLWAGLLILFLIGFSAVRYNTVSQVTTGDEVTQPPIDFGGGGLEGEGGELVPGGDLGGGLDLGGLPTDPTLGGGETPAGEGTAQNFSETLTIGFVAASEIVVSWLIISALLIVVSLLRGRRPRLGHNFQIAIWATLPLALMALLQVLFYAAGGMVGQPGLVGLLPRWDFYQQQAPMLQDILYSLAIRLTIFWVWTLALLYFGARNALQGPRLGALFIVVFWAVIVVVLPVVTGAVAAPDAEENLPVEEFPIDQGFPPGIEFPGGEFPGIVVTDETGNILSPEADGGIGTEESFPSDADLEGASESGNDAPTDPSTNSQSEINPEASVEAPLNESSSESSNASSETPVVRPVEGKPTP